MPLLKRKQKESEEMSDGPRQSLAIAYAMKKKKACHGGNMAEGGVAKDPMTGVHHANYVGAGNSPAGSFAKAAVKGNTSIPKEKLNEWAKEEHHRVLGEMRSDTQDRKNLAGGGMAEACPHCGHYSEGGEVANQDEPIADFMPNEFDVLHLEDGLESSYTGANSGDEDGPEGHEKNDIVSRILSKRKKQSNPRPS